MEVTTISYDGSSATMIAIVNEQADKGLRLVSVQDVEAGNFLSFVPKDVLAPNEQLSKAQERIAELEKADLDNKSMINDLGEALLALLEG